jgi:hypothetical protein
LSPAWSFAEGGSRCIIRAPGRGRWSNVFCPPTLKEARSRHNYGSTTTGRRGRIIQTPRLSCC